MTVELRLLTLRSLPPIGFISQSLTFDMTNIVDEGFRARLAQIIDLGFSASSDALRAETQILRGRGEARSIRFFTHESAFTRGASVISDTGESGASLWRGARGWMDNTSPVAERTDLRVLVDPTGGTGVSVLQADGTWRAPLWSLVGVVWHELHHLATTEHHKERQWPYSQPWAGAMERIKDGLPPVIWDPIAKGSVSINAQGWHVENCVCALANAA